MASGSAAPSARASRVNVSLISTSRPNVPTRARSSGRNRANSSAAAARSSGRLPSMLPDTSSITIEPNGLRRVVEEHDRLRLALVPHLEVALRQRRHEPAVAVGDGGEHPHGVAAAAEHWRRLLLLRLLLLGTSLRDAEQTRRRRRSSRAVESLRSSRTSGGAGSSLIPRPAALGTILARRVIIRLLQPFETATSMSNRQPPRASRRPADARIMRRARVPAVHRGSRTVKPTSPMPPLPSGRRIS